MAIYSINRTGFGTAAEAVISMIGELINGGMRMVYPNNQYGPIVPTNKNNLHPGTGFMMTTTTIPFEGDPYLPVARFILESTSSVDIKAVIGLNAVTLNFSGTIAPNPDGFTSTLTITTPPASGTLFPGMVVTAALVTGTTTTSATTTTTTTTPGPTYPVFVSAQVISGSGTSWKVAGQYNVPVATALTATDNVTTASDPSILTNGWRICFDFPLPYMEDYATTNIDATSRVRSAGSGALTDKVPNSAIFEDFVSIYLGTSVQLRNDGQISVLPDVTTLGSAVRVTYVQPDGLVGASYRTPQYNSVSTKTIAMMPPITVMKAYFNPAKNQIITTKRVGSNITDKMTLTGGETNLTTGKSYRVLPFTYINGDPLSNTDATLTGTGLGDAGSYAYAVPAGYENYSATSTFIPKGAGDAIKIIGVATEISGADVGFINRINLDRLSGLAIPLSYTLTMTKKGIFLGVWDVLSEQNGKRFNWLLVQRSVDRISGGIRGRSKTTETGKLGAFLDNTKNSVGPVYCVNSVNNLYYQFVVREEDQGGPTIPASAAVNSEDNTAIINPFDQQSITDDGKYVVTFLNKLSTSRYRYPDELDMVGTLSADVIGFGTETRIVAYDEDKDPVLPLQRVYRSMPSNSPFGTGMRLMVLTGWDSTENGIGTFGVPTLSGPPSETPYPPVTTTTAGPTTTTTAGPTTTTTAAPTTTTTTTPPTPSDRRLKRNIVFLETRDDIKLYSFQYLWGDEYFVGVMAQDLLGTRYESAVAEQNGYYTVDYSQLGFDMQLLSDYNKSTMPV
jgi:hypothetical protein